MPGQHSIFQENEFSVAPSASMSSALPSVEPIFPRSRDVRAKTCYSASCMRVLVAALASVVAITVLVFLCSRAQEIRAVQGLRSRRLANPEGRDAGVDMCSDPSGGEEPNQDKSLKRPHAVAPVESRLPIKKRLLARLADAGTGGDGPTCHQQEQQEQELRHEPAGAPFDSVPTGRALTPGELGLQPSPHLSGQTPEQQRTPTELDAATGLLTLTPHQHDAKQSVAGTGEAASPDLMRLQQEVYQHQGDPPRKQKQQPQLEQHQQVQDDLHRQRLLQYWQHLQYQQLLSTDKVQQQHFLFQQQEQGKQDLQKQRQHTQNLMQQQQRPQYWPQQQQQQYFSQQQGNPQPPQSQQHYGVQQREQYTHLLHQQEPNYFPEQKEQHSAQEESKQPHLQLQKHGEQVKQQERQVTATEQVGQEQEQIRQRQAHQGKPKLQEEGETHQLQPADEVPVQLEEDEWIFQVSPIAGEAEPSGSQEALQPYARETAAGPSTSDGLSGPVVAGFTRNADTYSGSASGVPRGEVAAVLGMEGARAAAAVMPDGQPSADPFSAASATAGGGMRLSAPLLASLLTSRIGAGEALAAAAPAAGSPLMAPVATPSLQGLRGPRTSISAAIREHPFVRLPRRAEDTFWGPICVDFEQALSSTSGLRNPIPLLHKARALLLKGVLSRQEMRELRQITQNLMEHAVHYQNQNVEGFRGSYAVERLGVRFMVLDVVVSTLIVLDQTPKPEDWQAFVSTISHDVAPLADRRSRAGRPNLSATRALELSRAIQTLKRGVRPEPRDLLRIKRMLLCLPTSPRNFQTAEFDPWREQDCNFTEVSFLL